MSENTGKHFEHIFKQSIDKNQHLIIRLPDPPQSFVQRSDTKFSNKNPCDYIIFDTENQKLYCMELKSTKFRSMSFQTEETDNASKMIKYHQIQGLTKFSEYKNVVPCFILNFRDEKNNMERTYFMHINNLKKMIIALYKKSFNEIDLIKYGAIKINGIKKRVNYSWNITELFTKIKDIKFD